MSDTTICSPERRGTNSFKWDALELMYGRDDLLPLWVADMDFKAPECVSQAMHQMADFGVFGYYKPPQSYFDAIINWEMKRHGYAIQQEWIRYTKGVVPGLHWFVNVLTDPGEKCIILTPCYYPFFGAVRETGRSIVSCDLVEDRGRYTIDFDKFEKSIVDNDVKAFLLCSPHNPVGRVWKKEELERLVAICARHGVWILSDEIHQDIVMRGHTHVPTATVGGYDRVITLTSVSKTFNLAGLQNAYAVIPQESVRQAFDQYTKSIMQLNKGCMFGYAAAEAAYSGGEPWLGKVLDIIEGNDEYMRRALSAALPGVVITPLEGTYLTWLDMRAYVPHDELRACIQEKAKLAVDYGDWFFENGEDSHIRINLATSRENIEIATDRLIHAVQGR